MHVAASEPCTYGSMYIFTYLINFMRNEFSSRIDWKRKIWHETPSRTSHSTNEISAFAILRRCQTWPDPRLPNTLYMRLNVSPRSCRAGADSLSSLTGIVKKSRPCRKSLIFLSRVPYVSTRRDFFFPAGGWRWNIVYDIMQGAREQNVPLPHKYDLRWPRRRLVRMEVDRREIRII